MSLMTRRSLLQSSLAATVAGGILPGAAAEREEAAWPAEPAAAPAADSALAYARPVPADLAPRERLLFDLGWRFHLGNTDDETRDFNFGTNEHTFFKTNLVSPVAYAQFNDRGWRLLDLPHDWAVELPFHNDPKLYQHGCKPLGRKYPETSVGWYRRVFEIPAADRGKRIALEFDGVFRDAMVLLNGCYLGRNLSGYAPFRFDITDFVYYGRPSALAVRVDASLNEGWFYEGAGIYRHVWLTKTSPVHTAPDGTYVRTAVRRGAAELTLSTEVENDADAAATCRVHSRILDAAGQVVAQAAPAALALQPWSRRQAKQSVPLPRPELWSVERPYLYRLETAIESGGAIVDRYETVFGVRTLRFDARRGFFLNGKPVKLQGTCNHQDHAGVGSALPDRVQYFRIERLKAMGANAYRTSHNPPTPALLDACDRLGMVVMDETRMMSSSPEGLSQLERLVRRDRNRPSVILWSLGNEEPIQGTPLGARVVAAMKRLVRRLDPSRPTTAAMNGGWGHGISAVLDIQGFNYNLPHIDEFHRKFPRQPSLGSETASTVSTRGIYANDPARGYVSAYDVNRPPWAERAESWWSFYDARRFLAGGFAWTGFDYRGEPTPYGWPCINSHFGILDTCGFAKDNFYYYRAWWQAEPVLHLFPHWNWSGGPIQVWAYSNLDAVELLLNGRSLGRQTVQRDAHLQWTVNYEPGAIEARGYRGGKLVLTARRETAGAPARLALLPDRPRLAADGQDVAMVTVEVRDAQGRSAPTADTPIVFAVEGPGRLIGVGNGDPSSHEADKGNSRRAFNGLCQAIVQTVRGQAGTIRLLASGAGVAPARLELASEAVKLAPGVAEVAVNPAMYQPPQPWLKK